MKNPKNLKFMSKTYKKKIRMGELPLPKGYYITVKGQFRKKKKQKKNKSVFDSIEKKFEKKRKERKVSKIKNKFVNNIRNFSRLSYSFTISVYIEADKHRYTNPITGEKMAIKNTKQDLYDFSGKQFKKANIYNNERLDMSYNFYGITGKEILSIFDEDGNLYGNDSKKYEELDELLQKLDRVDIWNSESYFRSSYKDDLIFQIHDVYRGKNRKGDEPIDAFEALRMKESSKVNEINDKNVIKVPNLSKEKDLCVYDMLLYVFKKRFHKKTPLSVEYIYKTIFEDEEFSIEKAQAKGLSFNNIKKFFKNELYDGVMLVKLDINKNLLKKYIPTKEDGSRKIIKRNASALYYIYHEKHCFLLDTQHFNKVELKAPELRKPSNNYHFSKDTIILDKVINNIEDFMKFYNSEKVLNKFEKLISKLLKKEKKRICNYNVIYNNSVNDLYFYLLKEKKIKCDIKRCRTTFILDFKIDNLYVKELINTNNGEFLIKKNTNTKLYNHWFKKLKNNIINENHKSNYSNNVLDHLNKYSPCPLKGGLLEYDIKKSGNEVYSLDVSKCHTSILKNLEYIPVVNKFDEFVEYKGEDIKHYNIYLIRNHFRANYWLSYGFFVKDKELIISVLTPSKLVKNTFNDEVKNLYDEKDLSITLKKYICNVVCGLTGKRQNENKEYKLFFDNKEAEYYRLMYNGNCSYTDDNEITFYEKKIKSQLVNGFRLIYIYIQDYVNNYFDNLKNKLLEDNLYPIEYNIDEIKFTGSDENVNSFHSRFFKNFVKKEEKNLFSSIGLLKLEKKIIKSTYNPLKYLDFRLPLEYINNIPIYIKPEKKLEKIYLNDEWNLHEIHNKLKNKTLLNCSAGVGKSYIFKNWKDKTVLFVCPSNTLCDNVKKGGLDAITYNMLLGLIGGKDENNNYTEEEKKRLKFDISIYNCIVFDEIGMIDIKKREKLLSFMNDNTNKMFFGLCDTNNQLEPIKCEINNIENKTEYYTNTIKSMFDYELELKINKRVKCNLCNKSNKDCLECEKERNIYIDICNYISNNNKNDVINYIKNCDYLKKVYSINDINTKKSICLTHKTRQLINDKCHNKGGYYKDLELIYNCNGCQNQNGIKLNKNSTFKIIDYDDKKKEYKLNDVLNNEFYFTKEQLDKFFSLPYAITCASSQGLTIDEKLCICIDHYFCDVRYIYTAFTRATNYKDVVFCFNMNISKPNYDRRILNYKNQDTKAKRKWGDKEYIDMKWIENKLDECHYMCCNCNCFLDNDYNSNHLWTVDRINNHLAHIKTNCQILCINCNVSKK